MEKQDAYKQMDMIHEARDARNSQIEENKLRRSLEAVKGWFSSLGSKIGIGKTVEPDQMVSVHFRVTGKELYDHFVTRCQKIDALLAPSTPEKPTFALAPALHKRLEYKRRYYNWATYHIDQKKIFWMTGDEVNAFELVQAEEDLLK